MFGIGMELIGGFACRGLVEALSRRGIRGVV
jgi:hypothetical protein